jgi:uncharacterized protein
MTVKSIFINLPVADLQRTRAFWTKLGFSFNEQFSDDRALCLVLNEGLIHAMLLTHDLFRTFTDRPIADRSTTQVLTAIEVESREQVDEMVKRALDNGGTRYREGLDHGWMYYDSFADPDGHQWEVMFTDPDQIPQVIMPQEKIKVSATVAADSQKVWDYYTAPEHITNWNFADPGWHCPAASNDLKVGGRYVARMEARDGSVGFDFEAVYTDMQPGEHFTYEFGGRFATVEFREENGATEVTVTFDPENEHPPEMQRDGWQAILNNFRRYTEEN